MLYSDAPEIEMNRHAQYQLYSVTLMVPAGCLFPSISLLLSRFMAPLQSGGTFQKKKKKKPLQNLLELAAVYSNQGEQVWTVKQD